MVCSHGRRSDRAGWRFGSRRKSEAEPELSQSRSENIARSAGPPAFTSGVLSHVVSVVGASAVVVDDPSACAVPGRPIGNQSAIESRPVGLTTLPGRLLSELLRIYGPYQ